MNQENEKPENKAIQRLTARVQELELQLLLCMSALKKLVETEADKTQTMTEAIRTIRETVLS